MDYSRLFTVALKNRWIAKFIVANLLIGHCFLVFVSANFQFRGASGKMVVAEVLPQNPKSPFPLVRIDK